MLVLLDLGGQTPDPRTVTKLRAWLNSSTGHKVVVGCVLLNVWVSVTVAHRTTHGDGFLPVLVLAAVAGVPSLTAAGALLAVAHLVNGGAVVFPSGLMFLQGEYIAAEYDRSAVLESLGVVALLVVVGTALAEARMVRARQRSETDAARELERRHQEFLGALAGLRDAQATPPRPLPRRSVTTRLSWSSHRRGRE